MHSDDVASQRSDWLLLKFEFSRASNNHVNGRETTFCLLFFKRNTTGPTFVMSESALNRFGYFSSFPFFMSDIFIFRHLSVDYVK